MASESSIQSKILEYINSLPHGVAENVSGNAQQSGRADINACINGKTFKIEVKTKDTAYGKKGESVKQRLYLEKWARAGAISCVVYALDDLRYMLMKDTFEECEKLNSVHLMTQVGMEKVRDRKKWLKLSLKGKWYDVQNKRWVDISY